MQTNDLDLSYLLTDIAVEVLSTAERLASHDKQQVLKANGRNYSHTVGQEYSLALAEAHLMCAVVLFLTESAIASIKGL